MAENKRVPPIVKTGKRDMRGLSEWNNPRKSLFEPKLIPTCTINNERIIIGNHDRATTPFGRLTFFAFFAMIIIVTVVDG